MLLLGVTVHIDAPELASDHTLFHPMEVCMAKQLFGQIDLSIVDTILQFNAQLPGEIIMTINETRISYERRSSNANDDCLTACF